MAQTKERAPLEAATSKSANVEHNQGQDTTKQARLQGPKYPNLLAISQGGGASICTMAGWINATEEVFYKIIWGKEEIYANEVLTLAKYLRLSPDILISPTLTMVDPRDPQQRMEIDRAAEEMEGLLQRLGPDADRCYLYTYQFLVKAQKTPVPLVHFTNHLWWLRSAREEAAMPPKRR